MKLYTAGLIKGGVIAVATGFLFFQCSDAPADSDGDGLIEIKDAIMLNNMRYNLAGTSYKTSADDTGDASGCPNSVCNGYELSTDIDLLSLLDANCNGMIDTITMSVAGKTHTVIDTGTGQDKSWVPIGDNLTNDDESRFTGTFEGNHHTIANLWVHVSAKNGDDLYAGLFGYTSGRITIRNVGIISGSIHSSSTAFSSSGGLVGRGRALSITNSYFSGVGGVSSSSYASYSGGLVGRSDSSLTITNCAFSGSGGVSSSSDSFSSSGGLVGRGRALSITNSYFSGVGGVSSTSASGFSSSKSGGLVAQAGVVNITNSYFSGVGGVSSTSAPGFSSSGGLVAQAGALSITNSYFSGVGGVSSSSSRSSSSGGLVGEIGSASNSLTITNCTFSGSGGVSSSSSSSSSDSSDSSSGGLVGHSRSSLTITNCTFSGSGGVSSDSSSDSFSSSGGLVGYSSNSLAITNCTFSGSGGVSSSPSSASGFSSSGGLVGYSNSSLTITNCTFSGVGDVSSSASPSSFSSGFSSSRGFSNSGGLVGYSNSFLTITNCTFSGSGGVSSSSSSASDSFSGSLVGLAFAGLLITNSYWNIDAPQSVNSVTQNPKRTQGRFSTNPPNTVGLTLMQLQAITGTHPSGLPNSATDNTKAWDLGTNMQLPAVKVCVNPTIVPPMMSGGKITVTCASYGALLAGQR